MGAYSGLSAYFEQPLCDYAIQFGYDESNIVILEGDINRLQANHIEIYNNLLSCNHHSDSRTPLQYAQDLVATWIFEDYFLGKIQNDHFTISKAGSDRTRIILNNSKTSTNSDYIVSTGTKDIPLELVNDYSDFWLRKKALHLRDNKYLKLKQSHSLLLAIDLSEYNQKFMLFNFIEDIPAKFLPYHPVWHKPAYELAVNVDDMMDFSVENVICEIDKVV